MDYEYNFLEAPYQTRERLAQRQMQEDAFYAAAMSDDPIANYKTATQEYLNDGKSSFVQSVQDFVNQDEDEQRRFAISSIIEDPSIGIEEKKGIIQNYFVTKDIPANLRSKYAKQQAAINELPQEYVAQTFLAKEAAAEVSNTEINKFAAKLDSNTKRAVAEFYLEAVPFIGSVIPNLELMKLKEAAEGKESGYLDWFIGAFLGGETIVSIRDVLDKLPPQDKKEAVSRMLTQMENMPGLDWTKYRMLQAAIEAPEYSTFERVLDDAVSFLDMLLIGSPLKKTVSSAMPDLKIRPKSPLGTIATHNKPNASATAKAIIADDTGKLAEALGEEKARIVADMFFAKHTEDALEGAPDGLVKELMDVDQQILEGYVRSQTSPFIYDRAVRDSVKDSIEATIRSFGGFAYSQPNSVIEELDEGFRVLATFGKEADTPFFTLEEAKNAAERIKGEVQNGDVKVVQLDPLTNTFVDPVIITQKYNDFKQLPNGEFVEVKDVGEYYVQWDHTRDLSPVDILAFGPDAIKASLTIPFTNKELDISWVARGAGTLLLDAPNFVKRWVAQGALHAADHALAIEKPALEALQKKVGKLSRKDAQELYKTLMDGADMQKEFKYHELHNRYAALGMSKKEIDRTIETYFMYRRVADWMYLFSNRKEKGRLIQQGMKEYNIAGKPLFGKELSRGMVKDSTEFWDDATESIVRLSDKQLDELYSNGGHIFKLDNQISVGNKFVDMGIAPKGASVREVPEFVLPRLPGYFPRIWDEYWFIDAMPKHATINGRQLSSSNKDHFNELSTLKRTKAAASTVKEAQELLKKLREERPEFEWDYRRDRSTDNSIFKEGQIFQERLNYSLRRGDKIQGIDGHAKIVDPLQSMFKSIQSISRHAAFDEYLQAFENSFVKQYGSFVKDGRFPQSVEDFVKPYKMGMETEKEFKNALSYFRYYKTLTTTRSLDEQVWKEGNYYIAGIAEKFSQNLGSLLKGIGDKYYPPNVLKRTMNAFVIALRPARQLLLQPVQIAAMSLATETPIVRGFAQTISMAWYYAIPALKLNSDLATRVGAKMAGMSVQDYTKFVEGFKTSGLVSSVDSHLLVAGWFNQGGRALKETKAEAVAANVGAAVDILPKVGKTVGFDLGEIMNLMGHYVIAYNRFIKNSPGIDVNLKSSLETIASDARELSGSMNRGGALDWNRGFFSLPLQYMVVPYKLLQQMAVSKILTNEEKGRLIAANIALYGATGVGLANLVDDLREEYGDAIPPDVWQAVKGGLMDAGFNHLLNAFTDDKYEANDLALSKAFAPLGDNIIPFTEVFVQAMEEPVATVMFGPSWSIISPETGRIPNTYRDLLTIWQDQKLDTIEKIKRSFLEAAELAAGGTDYMKYRYATDTGRILTTMGRDTGLEATRAVAIGMFWGVGSQGQIDMTRIEKKRFDEATERQAIAQKLYTQAEQFANKYGTDEFSNFKSMQQSYMSLLSEEERIAVRGELGKLMRKMAKDKQSNVMSDILRKEWQKSEDDRNNLRNLLRSSSNPQMNDLADRLNHLYGTEAY